MAGFRPDIPLRRFTVKELHRMRDLGILAPGARVELLAGLLVDLHRPTARELEATRRLVDALAHSFDAEVVRGEPIHPDGYATFDPTMMVHDWEELSLTAPFRLHRFNVAEYEKMLEAGLLPSMESYELLDGVVFDVDDRSKAAGDHAGIVAARLRSLAPEAVVGVCSAVGLGPYSRIWLDVAVCRPRADAYRRKPSTGEDVLIAIDVAKERPDVTQQLRWPLYARWHVPVAWLVDLRRGEVRVGRRAPPSALAVNVYRGEDVVPVSGDAGGIRAGELVGPD